MIYALISDVHGNLEALTAVMDDIKKHGAIDGIFFLGDAVGYGANPNEVLQIINATCDVKLMGNHDYSALGLLDPADFNVYAQSGISFSVSVLTPQSQEILSSFRLIDRVGESLLVHATPDAPESWNYCLSTAEANRQFDSVGQPRDGDPRACYAIHDTISQRLEYRRLSYDIEAAQHKMRAVDLPAFLIERLTEGR
ncbi:MAG: metallophosphoesterase family protein [candidate division Zixibacteria bacterium]|nr:metallophosphoesterase family protein [candidate division Zixibacteria bacterium]